MPILDLQRRMRQLGEIRLGHVVPTAGGKTRPAKLDKFRFTSPSREILSSVAELYGGEVKPWTPANGGPSEFEVYSTANRLPVLIPPAGAVSQWYELYQGSKCVRRCDGQTEHKSDRACLCNPDKRTCKITTRVNVMLRDVPALGQWLLISKGYYAGVTLPPAAELLAQAGGYVAGWLGMEEKLVQRDDGPARFMVPTLDVEITPAALMAGEIRGPAAVTNGPERVAITGGRPDYAALAAKATTPAEVRALYEQAVTARHMDKALAAALTARATALGATVKTPEQKQAEDVSDAAGESGWTAEADRQAEAEEVVIPEVVDEDDTEHLWFQIIAAAGKHDMTTDEVTDEFAKENEGLHPSTASADRLRIFLNNLKGPRA